MNKTIDKDLLNRQCAEWINTFNNYSGSADKQKILDILSARTFEGKPVKAFVVDSPEEVEAVLYQAIKQVTKLSDKKIKDKIKTLQPWNCIWDYYLMAFYEVAYKHLPNKNFPGNDFIKQSLFPAFQAGLGFLINLGGLLIGVCLPKVMKRDEQLRIHCQDGPAIVWGNAKYYWWHGVKVLDSWIENKEEVNVKLCLTHNNIEQRRALCEIIGWDKVISQLKATSVHKDEFGELLRVSLPDIGNAQFVKVLCATNRSFCLPVPLEIKTAHEAVAWTYNLNILDYKPEVRT
jgi:hypothetical protein